MGLGFERAGAPGNPALGGKALAPASIHAGPFTAVSAGGSHALALSNGLLWSWGYNQYGQIGAGKAAVFTSTPALVP